MLKWVTPLIATYAEMCREHSIYQEANAALRNVLAGPQAVGGEPALSNRALEKPRAGSAASQKAIIRRRIRYGNTGLSNEKKIEMRQQGQKVDDLKG